MRTFFSSRCIDRRRLIVVNPNNVSLSVCLNGCMILTTKGVKRFPSPLGRFPRSIPAFITTYPGRAEYISRRDKMFGMREAISYVRAAEEKCRCFSNNAPLEPSHREFPKMFRTYFKVKYWLFGVEPCHWK